MSQVTDLNFVFPLILDIRAYSKVSRFQGFSTNSTLLDGAEAMNGPVVDPAYFYGLGAKNRLKNENHDKIKETPDLDKAQWELYVDGSSNQEEAGVRIILSSPKGVDLETLVIRSLGDGHCRTITYFFGGKKFFLLATDYFTKWVEAEAYKMVTQTDVVRFVWCNILEQRKGKWSEELPNVLWAYRTSKRKPTGESPFSLAYGTEAVILIEIGLPTVRTLVVESNDNEQQLAHSLDLLEEHREAAALQLTNY
ncbi:hypothetical protein L3X38_002182 [Prunus dulcis]|uniref:Uncharacterized protein n=1 Tax=Prunus dulcis TaxID=3755 RepID=A0AAD4WTF3_PRUDU|nr:hypothetical protein L3X38_002182 [Prunus dulcis]